MQHPSNSPGHRHTNNLVLHIYTASTECPRTWLTSRIYLIPTSRPPQQATLDRLWENAQGPCVQGHTSEQVRGNSAALSTIETCEALLVLKCKTDVPLIPKDVACLSFCLPVLYTAPSFCFVLLAHASCHQSQVTKIAHLCPSCLDSPWL